jgi:hypothetical protein
VAAGITSGEDYDTFRRVLQSTHLDHVEHTRKARHEAKVQSDLDRIRGSIRIKRRREKHGKYFEPLTPEELAQELLDAQDPK